MNENLAWSSFSIEEVCQIEYGTRVTRKKDAGTIYPVYGGGGATFSVDDYNREDCVIVSRFAMSEKTVRRVNGKFFLNDSGLSLKTKNPQQLTTRYLEWFLFGLNDVIYNLGRGTAQKNLNINAFKSLEIKFPNSLEHQNRIVSKLDQAFEAIDRAIANTEKNIENVEELLKSSINTLISNVSSNYIEMNLNDLTTKIGSGATPKGGKSSYKLEGISLIRSMNVHDLRFKKKDLAFIDEYQAEKLNNVTLEKGDVLLNITGASISRTCIVPAEVLPARVNQHVSIIRAKKDLIRPAFLNLMLYSQRYKNEILGIGEKGATRQAITKGQLESLNVKFPSSLDKQDILIDKANYLLEKTRVLKDSYDKKLINLIELKMSILEKSFMGELV